MMDMKYLIILAMLLTGCSGGGSSDTSVETTKTSAIYTLTYAVYGDSLCAADDAWPSMLGMRVDKDCVSGRPLVHYTEESYSPSADVLIMALGSNDAIWFGVSPELYREKLESLSGAYQGELWCVLPAFTQLTRIAPAIQDYRYIILDICGDKVIEAPEPTHEDGVHHSPYDATVMAQRVCDALNLQSCEI